MIWRLLVYALGMLARKRDTGGGCGYGILYPGTGLGAGCREDTSAWMSTSHPRSRCQSCLYPPTVKEFQHPNPPRTPPLDINQSPPNPPPTPPTLPIPSPSNQRPTPISPPTPPMMSAQQPATTPQSQQRRNPSSDGKQTTNHSLSPAAVNRDSEFLSNLKLAWRVTRRWFNTIYTNLLSCG